MRLYWESLNHFRRNKLLWIILAAYLGLEMLKIIYFARFGFGFTVYAGKRRVEAITVTYSGSNEAYYANSQGMNLRGSFPYYPIPGHREITADGIFMNSLFLEQETEFDVEIKSRREVFSNLQREALGRLVGTSNGPMLLSGLYVSDEKRGVKIVYPIFNGWNDKELDAVAKSVIDDGYAGCQVFITPNVNRQNDAPSRFAERPSYAPFCKFANVDCRRPAVLFVVPRVYRSRRFRAALRRTELHFGKSRHV